MKEIKAYIRKDMMDRVIDAFDKIPDFPGIAFSEVGGFGRSSREDGLTEIRMMKLEIDVPDEKVETVVQIMLDHARTGRGHFGDGRIYVSNLTKAVRIRDGARGSRILR